MRNAFKLNCFHPIMVIGTAGTHAHVEEILLI